LAVKGSIYVDKNRNGKRDAGEANYTGMPLPRVKLVLFTNSCGGPTPSVTPSLTPIPPTGVVTPTPTCFTRKFCPMGILCRGGDKPWCPPCKEEQICVTGVPSGVPAGQPGQPIEISGKPIQITGEPRLSVTPVIREGEDATSDDEKRTAQQEDVCKRLPIKIINCPVTPDGTYACTVENQLYTDAWVRFYEPARYVTTSPNPVSVKGPAATVDFGIASFFPPLGPAAR
ncbi:MAG: hypothetical protein KGJ07_09880, partial [Patescibacteria group bacterium]|nr:hypothetical protein [Patescibacteria group bacterium]